MLSLVFDGRSKCAGNDSERSKRVQQIENREIGGFCDLPELNSFVNLRVMVNIKDPLGRSPDTSDHSHTIPRFLDRCFRAARATVQDSSNVYEQAAMRT